MNLALPIDGVVCGLGADFIEVERIEMVHRRHGERFLRRVFTPGEAAYCLGMKNPYPHLAARFAAKEAVSKAFTTGIGAELGWTSIEIVKGEREEPLVNLDQRGLDLLRHLKAHAVLVSLSHTQKAAMAVAMVLRQPAGLSHGHSDSALHAR